jgi:hypothetical protein
MRACGIRGCGDLPAKPAGHWRPGRWASTCGARKRNRDWASQDFLSLVPMITLERQKTVKNDATLHNFILDRFVLDPCTGTKHYRGSVLEQVSGSSSRDTPLIDPVPDPKPF